MKKLCKFAGILAILSFMTPSTFGQSKYFGNLKRQAIRSHDVVVDYDTDPTVVNPQDNTVQFFSSSSGTLDSTYAIFDSTSTVKFIEVWAFSDFDQVARIDWDTALLFYYCEMDTLITNAYLGKNISIAPASSITRGQSLIIIKAHIVADNPSSRFNQQIYAYRCRLELSNEQIAFLKRIKSLPGKTQNLHLEGLYKT